MADPETDAVRAALEAIITKSRPFSSFNTTFGGTPLVNYGETEFMTVKEARRLIEEIWTDVRAVLALPALSLPSPQVVDDRGEEVQCERCQGNGEIVTDWDRYLHGHEGDVGDEAVAECPDCNGEGFTALSANSGKEWEPSVRLPRCAASAAERKTRNEIARLISLKFQFRNFGYRDDENNHVFKAGETEAFDALCLEAADAILSARAEGDDPKALDAAAFSQSTADLPQGVEPVAWPNDCDKSVPAALRFLAENDRPSGGEQRFNRAHLYQLAAEVERMASRPLYTAEALALSDAARDRAVEDEREACAKLATSFLVGDPENGVPLRNPMAHEIADAIRARSTPRGDRS